MGSLIKAYDATSALKTEIYQNFVVVEEFKYFIFFSTCLYYCL